MDVARSGTAVVAVVAVTRFYLRPLRRRITGRAPVAPGTWQVRIGPVGVGDRQLVLRSPRLRDGAQWCAVRLADRKRIEPWWLSSPLPWEQRHTEAVWVRSWLQTRRAARAGLELPLVIEVDGRLAGQCGLEWIDRFTGSGELGLWLDSRLGGQGLGVAATRMLVDYAFDVAGLHRITAPVCTDNVAASRTMQRAGMTREATMSSFLDVGGRRRDHDLWAIVADRP